MGEVHCQSCSSQWPAPYLRETVEAAKCEWSWSWITSGTVRLYTLPISLRQADNQTVSTGTVTTPAVANSDLPGLLGLNALRKNRAVIDFGTLKMDFAGPGEYDLGRVLPPGTDCFQCELAPSGHMVLPCCEYGNGSTSRSDGELTLVTQQRSREVPEATPPGLITTNDRLPAPVNAIRLNPAAGSEVQVRPEA